MSEPHDILQKVKVEALLQCQKLVYLYRIRLKPLFLDYDKLRSGKVFESQFLRALTQSGLHKLLGAQQLQELALNFRATESEGKDNALHKTDYEAFLQFVEAGFGEKFLEKDPLKEVAHEPLHLLDRLRHQRTTKVLSPEKESKIEELVEKFIVDCKIKGIQVKHAFDDAAHAPKLAKIVNHVTVSQFFQGLCRLNLGIKASDAELLAEKFGHPEHADLVNYACFSKIVNPMVSA